MKKDDVMRVLASYSPPLAHNQILEAAEKIAELSAKEFESQKKEEPTRKSGR